MHNHPTKEITITIAVDERIADIIEWMNRIPGVRTISCCEGDIDAAAPVKKAFDAVDEAAEKYKRQEEHERSPDKLKEEIRNAFLSAISEHEKIKEYLSGRIECEKGLKFQSIIKKIDDKYAINGFITFYCDKEKTLHNLLDLFCLAIDIDGIKFDIHESDQQSGRKVFRVTWLAESYTTLNAYLAEIHKRIQLNDPKTMPGRNDER